MAEPPAAVSPAAVSPIEAMPGGPLSEPVSQTVTARVTGRFHLLAGAPGAALLVGFHGYGENGARILAELRRIPGLAGWSLSAIEALHPFYTRQGEVVRSWMTREDREAAIADNVAYVGSVLERISGLVPFSGWVACGFSQGTAMAWRAAAVVPGCRGVVALGGDLPAELDVAALGVRGVLLGRGGEDEWYTPEKLATDRSRLLAGGISPEVCEYAGGHEWTDDFRAAAGRFLGPLGGASG